MVKVKLRAAGRPQFWSAGRRWTDEGRVVSIVANDPLPRKFLRAEVDKFGNYVLDESRIPDGEYIPVVPARSTRAFWSGNTMVIRVDSGERDKEGKPALKEYATRLELDFPGCDAAFQDWASDNRRAHDALNEITQSDYAQVCADSRFLAVENPELPKFEPPPVQVAGFPVEGQQRTQQPQPQAQARK